jgi:LPS-assembly lipoprotein
MRRIWQRRATFCAAALALALSACGFEPLYGERANGSAAEAFEMVRISVIADRSGQILRNYLLDDLQPRGARGPGRYSLDIRLQEPRQELAVRRDDSAARIGYSAAAIFVLNAPDGRRLLGGSSSASTTFEISDSEFATLSSYSSARSRSLQDISADIRNQLAIYFLQNPPR